MGTPLCTEGRKKVRTDRNKREGCEEGRTPHYTPILQVGGTQKYAIQR